MVFLQGTLEIIFILEFGQVWTMEFGLTDEGTWEQATLIQRWWHKYVTVFRTAMSNVMVKIRLRKP